MARQALGKGLGALIPEAILTTTGEEVKKIAIEKISPNPYQPRRYFDPERLAELAASIKEHGVLQPLIVRRAGERYELVAGERRWRAAQQAGLTEVPAVVRELDEATMMKIALVENLQREDLNPLEEAQAYHRLMQEFHLTQEEVAQAVGKSRSAVANALRLLMLPAPIQESLARGEITAGHARAILAVEGEAAQVEAWRRILQGKLTVRQAENLGRTMSSTGETPAGFHQETLRKETEKERTLSRLSPELRALEDRLRERLGTKVQILPGRGKGRIEIEYYGDEDLERLITLICERGGEK